MNWAPGEPNDYHGDQGLHENCALLMPGDDGRPAGTGSAVKSQLAVPLWNDNVCDVEAGCICETPADDVVPAPPPPPPSPPPPPQSPPPPDHCQRGWWPARTQYGAVKGRTCYKKLEGKHTKAGCDAACVREGGSGLCIDSMAENDGIFAGARIEPRCCGENDLSCCTWLGLVQSDSSKGARYHWDQWSNGCSSGFRHWAVGEPNDWQGNREDCAIMGFYGGKTPEARTHIYTWAERSVRANSVSPLKLCVGGGSTRVPFVRS